MQLYPAIDISESKCVRLKQGDFSQKTVYYDYPLDAAKYWESQGATHLHVVDLDGSKDGHFVNLSALKDIKEKTSLHLQFGGGIRTRDDVSQLIDIGIERIVIGSLATKDFTTFSAIAKQYTRAIVCAIDFKQSSVMVEGWQKNSRIDLFDFIKTVDQLECGALLVTNIARDGMLCGPDIETYKKLLKNLKTPLIASGGVADLKDLVTLKSLGINEVVIGKALYEKRFSLPEAIAVIGGLSC